VEWSSYHVGCIVHQTEKTNIVINLWNLDLVPFLTCFLHPLSLASFIESEKSFCQSMRFSSKPVEKTLSSSYCPRGVADLGWLCGGILFIGGVQCEPDSKTLMKAFRLFLGLETATLFFGLGPIVEHWCWWLMLTHWQCCSGNCHWVLAELEKQCRNGNQKWVKNDHFAEASAWFNILTHSWSHFQVHVWKMEN